MRNVLPHEHLWRTPRTNGCRPGPPVPNSDQEEQSVPETSPNTHTALGDTRLLLGAPKVRAQLLNLGKGESSWVNPSWRSGMGKPKSGVGLEQSSRWFLWCRSASQAQPGHAHKLPQLLWPSQAFAELVVRCPSHHLHPLSWHHLHIAFILPALLLWLLIFRGK